MPDPIVLTLPRPPSPRLLLRRLTGSRGGGQRGLSAALAVLVLLAAAATGWLVTRPDPKDVRPEINKDGEYAVGSLPTDDSEAATEAAVEALPDALSYDFRTLEDGLAAATERMTEEFAEEFTKTFDKTARPMATEKSAVATAFVRGAGLVRMDGSDRATCLAYVDQMLVSSTTMKDQKSPVKVSQNRIIVELRRDGDTWKVDGIDPF